MASVGVLRVAGAWLGPLELSRLRLDLAACPQEQPSS